jgi:flavin reductase (DIM6/NTAB) family NADH-FMN oxidoreductase RutF
MSQREATRAAPPSRPRLPAPDPPADAAATGRWFRHAAGQFATGVTVVGTLDAGVPHAMTVSSFTSVSIDPLLVLVSLRNEAWTWRRIRRAGVFAVTVLAVDQEDVARRFGQRARSAGDAFDGIDWRPAPVTGAPVLTRGISYFDCTVRNVHPAGDHSLVIGAVQAFDVLSERAPLLFVRSRFGLAAQG